MKDVRFKTKVLALAFLAPFLMGAQSGDDILGRANALYKEGRYKQAEILYRKAAARGVDQVAVSFNIGNSLFQSSQYAEAAAAYRKAVDYSEGKFAPALFNLASVYFRLKAYPECIATYRRALKLEPENVSGWLYLGEAYSKTGDKMGALQAIEKAYRLDKSDISIVYQLSEANISLEDFDSAVRIVRDGYAAHPEETDFLIYLGDVYRMENKFDESASAYREALGIHPDDVNTLYKLADVLVEDDKPFVAMDVLTNILNIKPDFSDAAIFLGNLAYDAKFWERAEIAYEMAARAHNVEAIFGFKNLSYEAKMQKRIDEARRYLTLAKKYYPNDKTIDAEMLDLQEE